MFTRQWSAVFALRGGQGYRKRYLLVMRRWASESIYMPVLLAASHVGLLVLVGLFLGWLLNIPATC